MTDETKPQSSTDAQSSDKPAEGESQEPEQSGASTLEEVETYWRKRMSNSDKAHAAANTALKEQVDALQRQPEGEGNSASADDPQVKAALENAAKAVQAAEARAKSAELKGTYPLAVEAVGAEAATRMTPEALAALNTNLDFDATAPRIDPNNPPAAPRTAAKTLEEMSVEETIEFLKTQKYNAG